MSLATQTSVAQLKNSVNKINQTNQHHLQILRMGTGFSKRPEPLTEKDKAFQAYIQAREDSLQDWGGIIPMRVKTLVSMGVVILGSFSAVFLPEVMKPAIMTVTVIALLIYTYLHFSDIQSHRKNNKRKLNERIFQAIKDYPKDLIEDDWLDLSELGLSEEEARTFKDLIKVTNLTYAQAFTAASLLT